ncbi:AAA family ATPase [Brachybacterium sp. AOP29-B2-41]|uniref:AAA family ATPase n=1 Tax=Brachybacterium sp. AOP29-B2-41 TaxID=3457704 RepID=UPI004033E883
MIQLEHLHIKDFRGIRLIDLPLGSKSFAVHGPNGSGKSGVVDAIDFALTGSITRLAGEGTGNVTLLRHGPHVHKRDDPAAAVVELTVRDVTTGDNAVLRRNVKEPAKFTLEPGTESVRTSIIEAQSHPELTLSRRQIIRYVVSKPGDRAQQVQALLKLNRLDDFRKLLKSTLGKTEASLKIAATEVRTAETNLTAHLSVGELLEDEIIHEVNKRREMLNLEQLAELSTDTELNSGLKADAAPHAFNLVTAQREVDELELLITDPSDIKSRQAELSEAITSVTDDPTLLDALKHQQLVEDGLREAVDRTCPLCDHEWESVDALRAHLTAKLQRSASAGAARTKLTTAARAYQDALKKLQDAVDRILPTSKSRGVDELPHHLTSFSAGVAAHSQEVGGTVDSIVVSKSLLIETAYAVNEEIVSGIATLRETLRAEPDQSSLIAAQSFLTVAQERWARVRVARVQAAKADAVRNSAKIAYDSYCNISDSTLQALYETVEADFSRYYQIINADDEGNFSAQLKPTAGSLDLTVDFYGLGKFPPTAYHSEGHQDGMGVCLYLALMKQILGSNFRYAVLDDVVMSVDVNHRRQFCVLLKTEFPDTQFIITTHDSVWARQMQSAGLITSKSQARFYGWTVTDGPIYEQGDVWESIESDLGKGDVAGAAHKLRRRLEAAAGDIADSIGGRVQYRGDNSYDLSVLLDAIKGRHGELLKLASAVANSWGDQPAADAVKAKKDARSTVIPEQASEAWIINALVHNNDWANASVNDLKPVLEASRGFLDLFTCNNTECTGWIYVVGRPEESLRCRCGRYNLNLRKK